MQHSRIKNIIWDWNGTLLNDMSICIKCMNLLLAERHLSLLTSDRYKEVFTFPVRKYYEAIGFDFSIEKFDIPALEFIRLYKKFLPDVKLFNEAEVVLNRLTNRGINHWVLSAMEQSSLRKSVKTFKIDTFFKEIAGIQDDFAFSKIDRGKALIERNRIDKNTTLMVGDTLHDAEVAETLGIKSVLISQGHQSYSRLNINGNTVFQNLGEFEKNL